MKTGRVRAVLTVAVLAAALLVPIVAVAAPPPPAGWVLTRGLIGLTAGTTEYLAPKVSGDNVVWIQRSTVPGSKWQLVRYNLRSGGWTTIASNAAWDIGQGSISGKWVVWSEAWDIHAKNLSTGTVKHITTDGVANPDNDPVVSGDYAVWPVFNGTDWDLKGRNIATMGSVFTVASGVGNQDQPSINGKRVAYRDGPAPTKIRVKTIGSSAAAKLIADNANAKDEPSIGNHVVVWRELAGGHWKVRYYNYDTDQALDAASSGTFDLQNPKVSGDRIIWDLTNGADADLWWLDIRMSRALAIPQTVAGDSVNEFWGDIGGNEIVYLANGFPRWAKLAPPSLSIASVPRRIAHGGHIHLKGTLKDQGIPIAGKPLRVEKYSSSTGKWNLAKTLTTNASGAYAYKTPKTNSKTKYRVAYDGDFAIFAPTQWRHMSVVSKVKTAWPR